MTKIPKYYEGEIEPVHYISAHALNFNRGCVVK